MYINIHIQIYTYRCPLLVTCDGVTNFPYKKVVLHVCTRFTTHQKQAIIYADIRIYRNTHIHTYVCIHISTHLHISTYIEVISKSYICQIKEA